MFNLKFKLTPFWLFIILLTVLIISIVIGINTIKREEGFISYYYDKPSLNTVDVSGYYNPGSYKLYDNIFFDRSNGSVLYVYGDASNSTLPVDVSGTTVSKIIITDRYGNQTTNIKDDTNGIPRLTRPTGTQYSGLVDSYSSFEINPLSSFNEKTNNTLFYIPWGKKTYVHVVDLSTNTAATNYQNVSSFLFNGDSAPVRSPYISIDSNFSIDDSIVANNPAVNLWIVDPSHGDLYQINNYIYFKKTNGALFIKNSQANLKYDIYKRNSGTNTKGIKYTDSEYSADNSNNIVSVPFKPWTLTETNSNRLVLFVPDEKNTVVAVIKKTRGIKNYELESVKLFNSDGNLINPTNGQVIPGNSILYDSSSNKTPGSSVAGSSATGSSTGSNMPSNLSEDYYKWYWYWNTTGGTTLPVHFSEDYLLKTQIVPPVCPSCPDYGKCNSCGGSNSSCSKVDNKSDNKSDKETTNKPVSDSYNKTLDTTSNLLKSTGSGATNLAKETVSETTDLLKSAGSGASSFIKDSASGIGKFAKDTASGTVGLAKDTVSGTVGLAKDTVSGTVGLIKDAGRGTSNFLKDSNREQRLYGASNNSIGYNASPVQGSYGVSTTNISTPLIPGQPVGPMNPYTYNGALSQKPSSNFMPLTADFSKFGR